MDDYNLCYIIANKKDSKGRLIVSSFIFFKNQIWLNLLMDDYNLGYIIANKKDSKGRLIVSSFIFFKTKFG